MAVLASSAAAAIVAAAAFPSCSLLSATQIKPSGEPLTAGTTLTEEAHGFEIMPKGKKSRHDAKPVRLGSTPAFPIASPSPAAAAEPATSAQRAVLQKPVFSLLQSEGEKRPPQSVQGPSDTTRGQDSSEPTLERPPERLEARFGHSGMGQRPAGYNYVAAAGISALPYAGSSAIPATRILTTPAESQQQPTTPVPAVPFETPDSSGEFGVTKPADPPTTWDSIQVTPQPAGPEARFEPPTIHSGLDPQPQIPEPKQPSPSWGHSFAAPAPGTSGFRATVEADAQQWMDPYQTRTGLQPSGVEPTPTPVPSVIMPTGYSAWWDPLVQQRAGIAPRAMPVDVTSLVQQALQYSPQVQVLQADPEVLRQVVKVEEAAFDWRAFLDAAYDDLNDPVGNKLTTGNNANRFTDNIVKSTGGVRRRTEAGGELEVSQRLGHQYNNSIFLLPNPQSTSRLELSFRQPLLGRAGVVYNQNQIVLAQITANVSNDDTLQEIQSHLFRVAESYWKLYRARAEFFQRQKLLTSAQKVLTTLEGRNEVDTIPRQILRARAAVARAESRMQRAVTDIRNAESQLRLLVNDPAMLNSGPTEFTPTEMPATIPSPTGLRESLQEALVNRPDISRAIRQMRASGVRLGVSKSEMLPKLDFIITSYVAGLQERAEIVQSFANQFDQGRPGYTVGMEFEVPLGNRAARARMEQRQWELRRAINGFRSTVETSLTEVEIACREVDTSWREMLGKYEAMVAAQNEVSYLQDRFDVLPAVEDSSVLLLENLLDGYERLADEEAAFSLAQSNYALSLILLRRTTGVLLRSRHEAPQLESDESDYLTSRMDQTAEEFEARTSATLRTAGLTPTDARGAGTSTPAAWSAPVGQRPETDSHTTAPIPRRRGENGAPQAAPSVGGHSFGQGK